MTKVKFLIEKEVNPDFDASVFAFFPEMNYYSEGNIGYGGVTKETWQDTKGSYASIGQHSACHIDYANECKEAQFNEYSDLLRELINQGYNDLQILNKQDITYHRHPTEEEIKFGSGATHYRQFNLPDILTKKGQLKKWVISKDDGLRYYR